MAQAPDDLQNALASLQVGNYVTFALFALAAHEYIVTFDQEISCVWKKRVTVSSALLLSTRWVMVIAQGLTTFVVPNVSICRPFSAMSIVSQLLVFVSYAQIALFSSLRVYALFHDSRYRYLLSATVMTLSCAPIATNSFGWSRRQDMYVGPPLDTCIIGTAVPETLNNIMLYFTRCNALAADLLVVVLTWGKTFAHRRQLRRLRTTPSISTLLLRDGTIYFLFLLALDVARVLTYQAVNVNGIANVALDILQGLPPVLTQRFMLNLRQFDQSAAGDKSFWDTRQFSTIRFRAPPRVLGNIGEPLSFGELETLDDETQSLEAAPSGPTH